MNRYITFYSGDELFGINLLSITEMALPTEHDVVPLPGSPIWLEGLINLRGRLLPVIDLRKKLGISESSAEQESRFLACKTKDGKAVSIRVDSIADWLEIRPGKIVDPKEDEVGVDIKYLWGVRHVAVGTIMLLDINSLVDR